MTDHGKVAIVTGGGRGLGRAMALGLIQAGFRVAITAARRRDEIEAVAKEAPPGQIHPFMADASRQSACASLIEQVEVQLGPVDVLVNNAGRGMRFVSERFFSEPHPFWQTDPDTWRMVIETNVNGPFFMSRAVAPGMIARRWGRIVNISMNHTTMRRRGFSPYGPSKAALESETIIWAQDLAGTGVTVNALLPGGATLTGMIPDDAPAEFRKKLISPEIMVAPLLWLVSDFADGFSGKRLNASFWDSHLDPSAAAAKACEPAQWGPVETPPKPPRGASKT
ncbi:MAG TPA: SDR family oxidoreductase [Patescibacteria group bacterium]|nr:SDR family oxidoreductase [Patescibacteria group bacterium]